MNMQLMADGRPWVSWDAARHPHWPPVDRDGQVIGDVPWKFFDPEAQETTGPPVRGRLQETLPQAC